MNNTTFEYGGFHFIPHSTFKKSENFQSITRKLRSHNELGLSVYNSNYNHQKFYEASTDKKCDVFKCVETGKLYVPCNNELFEYKLITRKEPSYER